MSPQCIICDAITRMIHTPLYSEFFESLDFTEAEDAVSWNCKVHEPVLEASNIHDNGLFRRGKLSLHKDAGSPIFWVDGTHLHLARSDNEQDHYGMGRIIRDPEWIDLSIIQGFIDNCKRSHGPLCEGSPFHHHGQQDVRLPLPSFLIDVSARCIVQTSQIPQDKLAFVALSYVRRSTDSEKYLSLTRANLASLQRPGALSETAAANLSEPNIILPTFRDAMNLVGHLGIPYLWIDRLCIPQDDDDDAISSENAKSPYISAGAEFVLAECDGTSADHGIRGLKFPEGSSTSSFPRSFAQRSWPFESEGSFIRLDGESRTFELERRMNHREEEEKDWEHMYATQMRSRAETATARRVLRFEMGTVHWKCQSVPRWARGEPEKDVEMGLMAVDEHMWESCAHECSRERYGCPMDGSHDEVDIEKKRLLISGGQVAWYTALGEPYPPVRRYYAMLTELSQLQIPHGQEEDMLDVAAGLVGAFAKHIPGRMLNGLPETYFDLAMLWRFPNNWVRNTRWPSWSWAGWKWDGSSRPWGLLHAPEVDGADHIVENGFPSVEIIPVVEWYVGGESGLLGVQDRVKLDSQRWHEIREAFRDPRAGPPPGWTAVEGAESYLLWKNQAPRGYDTTRTFVREGWTEYPLSFWYPVPMREDIDHTLSQAYSGESWRYLFAALNISRQGFYVHRDDWPGLLSVDDPEYDFVSYVTGRGVNWNKGTQVLRDANGNIAGVLDVHDADHERIFHSASSMERSGVELVAVSRGQTRQWQAPYPEWDARPVQDFTDESWYEFYNVLWVKWRTVTVQDEQVVVAERRGLGRVFRDSWEAAQTGTENIVLG